MLGISVLTISSDSDPKYNSAMRRDYLLGHQSNLFGNYGWFSSGGINSSLKCPFFVQDTVHIATKMRNFLLKTKSNVKKLPFGNRIFVSLEHIEVLLTNFTKDQHQLTATVLNPVDKQNFNSVLPICDTKVISLLESRVLNSEATVIFLKLLRNIISAYMQPDLSPLERVNKIWYSLFVIRIWREYVVTHVLSLMLTA